MEERFLYTVYPKKPIRGVLPGNKAISSGKSLSLTKEEVLGCMKFGTVYRRFANEGRNERVTTLNLDRLHNAKFIEPKDWNVDDNSEGSVVEPPADNRGTVIDTNPVVEKTPLEKAQEIQEEIKKIDPEIEKEVETAKKEANVAPDTEILASVSMNENGTEEAPAQEEVAEEDKIEDESAEDESTDGEDEEEEDDSESSEEAASEDLGVTVNSGNNHNHKKKKRH